MDCESLSLGRLEILSFSGVGLFSFASVEFLLSFMTIQVPHLFWSVVIGLFFFANGEWNLWFPPFRLRIFLDDRGPFSFFAANILNRSPQDESIVPFK